MGSAREEMFQTSVNTVADWVEKQYTQSMVQTYDDAFVGICGSSVTIGSDTISVGYCTTKNEIGASSMSEDSFTKTGVTELKRVVGTQDTKIEPSVVNSFLKAAGVDPANYSYMSVQVTNGRACVKLTAASGGDFDAYKGTTKSSTGC